jgi:hypothetical protein
LAVTTAMDFGVSTPVTTTGGGGVTAAGEEEPPPHPYRSETAEVANAAYSRFLI